MLMIFGGVGALLLIVILTIYYQDSGNGAGKGGGGDPASTPPRTSSGVQPQPRMSSAKAGKTPGRPAPALTAATLSRVRELLQEAKAISNDGVRERTAGNNTKARAKQSEAKKKIDELKLLFADASEWQEEADMGDWEQPGAYVTLGKIWVEIARLQKKIRMSGGR